ncbi:hypothetical protein D915_007830 [Fasciola hepatica]|uniref:Anaphase-promoting complex subunit CDC26 n=1 Tax=Fasciola hepatica TaxID=6192 RepID=A0A4E0R251_FASHE|nr:hypothetical protein D915_007830 [Fasciola hepatica]
MQRRPLTRIDYGLQDIIEFKRYIDSRKVGETTKADEAKSTPEASHQPTEQEKRKQAVRQRIGLTSDQ